MDHENCRALLSSLSDFVDGVLEDELCDEIERHMGECENCRIVVDTLRKTISLYQATTPKADLPENVRERLYHRLDLSEFLDV
jgi:predicted anti-sigma-YlaC factor YlaD